MPQHAEDIRITILLGTFLVLFFALAIVFLISIFNKKNLVHQREKEIIQTSFEQAILQSQIEIQAQTFHTISQEIHDNVGQVLSLAKVQLNIIDQNNSTDKTLLYEAKDNISRAMSDLRDIAKSLNSDRIQELGLKNTVAQALNRIGRSGIVHTSIDTNGEEQRIDASRELILYRIIQECLQNVIKHAHATEISIFFNYFGPALQIEIRDNGKGFNTDAQHEIKDGLGLQNIIKRTVLIGGVAAIESDIGLGTTVKISIPYV